MWEIVFEAMSNCCFCCFKISFYSEDLSEGIKHLNLNLFIRNSQHVASCSVMPSQQTNAERNLAPLGFVGSPFWKGLLLRGYPDWIPDHQPKPPFFRLFEGWLVGTKSSLRWRSPLILHPGAVHKWQHISIDVGSCRMSGGKWWEKWRSVADA